MVDENSKITIDVDFSNFDPENETGNNVKRNFAMIVKAAPKYKVKITGNNISNFKASGKAGDLFRWWNDWFKICGVEDSEEMDFDMFKEAFFLDEEEDLEASTNPKGMEKLLSAYDPEEDMEFDDEDGDSEFTEWGPGELESEARGLIVQAAQQILMDNEDALFQYVQDWIEAKADEGYDRDELDSEIGSEYIASVLHDLMLALDEFAQES